MEVKNYAIGTLTILLLVSLGFNVQPSDTHLCRDRDITYHCDSLSKYYGLPNGKCVNDMLPNKVCRTGWEEISQQPQPPNKPVTNSNQWLCGQENCVPKQ